MADCGFVGYIHEVDQHTEHQQSMIIVGVFSGVCVLQFQQLNMD